MWKVNKILIENDIEIFQIPVEKLEEFKGMLIEFYETGDDVKINGFMKENCIRRVKSWMDYFMVWLEETDMGDKYSLIDLGNISEPAAGVINNFVDKISSALGWMVTPKNIKPAIIEANKSIFQKFSKDGKWLYLLWILPIIVLREEV